MELIVEQFIKNYEAQNGAVILPEDENQINGTVFSNQIAFGENNFPAVGNGNNFVGTPK